MGQLELREVRPGLRKHFLDGRLVEVGDVVDVLLAGGVWVRGTYDWSQSETRWPGLRFDLGGPWESAPDGDCRRAVMALHPDAILRWATAAIVHFPTAERSAAGRSST